MASNTTITQFSKASDAQASSLLFTKLPAELRNEIYKLVHISDTTNDDGTVDLEAASPPTKSLALTCQRVHAESYGLFRPAYQDYWRSEFVVDALYPDMVATPFCNADEAALAHITKLKIRFYRPTQGGLHAAIHISKTAERNGQLLWETPDLLSTKSPVDSTKPINKPDGVSNPWLALSMNLMKDHYHSNSWMQVMMNLSTLNESCALDFVVLRKFLRGVAPGQPWDTMPEPRLGPRA